MFDEKSDGIKKDHKSKTVARTNITLYKSHFQNELENIGGDVW
jgi:hypothetical protein